MELTARPHMSRKHWAQRVMELQSQRNPEEISAAQAQIEKAREREVCSRKCKAVKGLAIRNCALAAEGLNQMAQSSAPEEYGAVQERWRCAQEFSRARQQKKCKKLGKASKFGSRRRANRSRSVSRSGSDESRASSPASLLRDASGSEEDVMEAAGNLMGASDVVSMAAIGNAGLESAPAPAASGYRRRARSRSHSGSDVDSSDDDGPAPAHREPAASDGKSNAVATLLGQLTVEPSDAAECAAKFSLYEGYASEVENMRNTLLKFHEESRPTLPEAIVKGMDKSIKSIDSVEAMGIPDGSSKWFVFHMMYQAERNNTKMAGILDEFDKKLKFLVQNDQVECPVCLDSFDSGAKAAETLGCCHKVCKECWQNWARVMEKRPFCPLCRHEEFIGVVASRASDTAHDSDTDMSE